MSSLCFVTCVPKYSRRCRRRANLEVLMCLINPFDAADGPTLIDILSA